VNIILHFDFQLKEKMQTGKGSYKQDPTVCYLQKRNQLKLTFKDIQSLKINGYKMIYQADGSEGFRGLYTYTCQTRISEERI
jgi:lipoprotein NlpI